MKCGMRASIRQGEFGDEGKVVGEARPVVPADGGLGGAPALGDELVDAPQAAGVNVIKLGEGQTGGEGAAVGGAALAVQAACCEQAGEGLAPVVEVARHEQGCLAGHFAFDEVLQLPDLAHAAGADEAQVNDDDVHLAALHVDDAVQQAALLEAVVGDVLMLVAQHGPAGEQGVAMLAVGGEGVLTQIGRASCRERV